MPTDASDAFALGLSGKVVFITGAGGGIGRAVAQRFAALGAKLVLADIDPEGLEATRAACKTGTTHRLDLADHTACQTLVDTIVAKHERIDVFVNAGAVILRQALHEVSEESFGRQVAVNMAAPFYLARAVATGMRRQGGGRLVLFSSQGAHTGGYVGSTVYAMTKAAVVSLTKSLSREFAADGICVNAIAPGLVDTAMARTGVSAEAYADFVKLIPMGRMGQPEELANCCLFLASDWASYLTGHTLDVNGGQLMR